MEFKFHYRGKVSFFDSNKCGKGGKGHNNVPAQRVPGVSKKETNKYRT